MLFGNIELHNVSYIEPAGTSAEDGYRMFRVPADVRSGLNPMAQERTACADGVELRFVLTGKQAKITLSAPSCAAPDLGALYFGSVQAGWTYGIKAIGSAPSELIFTPPDNVGTLKDITKKFRLPFSPEVIRLLLPAHEIHILNVEGDCRPPLPEELPQKKILFYGSSITHGSMSLVPNMTFADICARRLRCDKYNLGFAGSAHIEDTMADYIASRAAWDILVAELGINVLHFTAEEFKKRVEYFIGRIAGANPGKPVFIIDIFYCSADMHGDEKVALFRRIVREAAEKCCVNHIDGTTLLTSPLGLSGDLVHPNVDGIVQMGSRLAEIIGNRLGMDKADICDKF